MIHTLLQQDLPGPADNSATYLLGSMVGGAIGMPILAWCWARFRLRRSVRTPWFSQTELSVAKATKERRKLSRLLRAGQLAGFAVMLLGIWPYGLPLSLLLVPFGIAIAVVPTLVARRADIGSNVRRSIPWLSAFPALVGWVLILVGVTVAAWGWLAKDLSIDPALDARGTGLWAAGAVLALAGAVLNRFGQRVSQRKAFALLEKDGRAPVVYLRSFDDDGLRILKVASPRRPLSDVANLRPTERFEECLAGHLAFYGPPVAISDPRTRRRPLGISRDEVASTLTPGEGPGGLLQWQTKVLQWMRSARLVVAVAGTTEGLEWELVTALQTARDRLLCILPPDRDSFDARVAQLVAVCAKAGVTSNVAEARGAVAAVVRDGRLQWITSDRRDEAAYREAVDRAANADVDATPGRGIRAVPMVRQMTTGALGLAAATFMVVSPIYDRNLDDRRAVAAAAAFPDPGSATETLPTELDQLIELCNAGGVAACETLTELASAAGEPPIGTDAAFESVFPVDTEVLIIPDETADPVVFDTTPSEPAIDIDQLIAECWAGEPIVACDVLYNESEVGSEAERIGYTCGDRVTSRDTDLSCVDPRIYETVPPVEVAPVESEAPLGDCPVVADEERAIPSSNNGLSARITTDQSLILICMDFDAESYFYYGENSNGASLLLEASFVDGHFEAYYDSLLFVIYRDVFEIVSGDGTLIDSQPVVVFEEFG